MTEEIQIARGDDIPIEERIYSSETDPELYEFHVVTLQKVSEGSAPPAKHKPWLARRRAQVGEFFTYTYKSFDNNTALARATAALIREFPDENRMNWKLVSHT